MSVCKGCFYRRSADDDKLEGLARPLAGKIRCAYWIPDTYFARHPMAALGWLMTFNWRAIHWFEFDEETIEACMYRRTKTQYEAEIREVMKGVKR